MPLPSPAELLLEAELKKAWRLTKREWYRKVYLKSKHWCELRDAKKKALKSRCEICDSPYNIDVHHINYRSIFDVKLGDLQVLCRRCHKGEHRKEQKKKHKKKKIKIIVHKKEDLSDINPVF